MNRSREKSCHWSPTLTSIMLDLHLSDGDDGSHFYMIMDTAQSQLFPHQEFMKWPDSTSRSAPDR